MDIDRSVDALNTILDRPTRVATTNLDNTGDFTNGLTSNDLEQLEVFRSADVPRSAPGLLSANTVQLLQQFAEVHYITCSLLPDPAMLWIRLPKMIGARDLPHLATKTQTRIFKQGQPAALGTM